MEIEREQKEPGTAAQKHCCLKNTWGTQTQNHQTDNTKTTD